MNPEMVTIKVGMEKQPFPIHKELLVYQSKHFRAAFEGGFKEAEDKIVTLTDVHEDDFRMFFHWLYK